MNESEYRVELLKRLDELNGYLQVLATYAAKASLKPADVAKITKK